MPTYSANPDLLDSLADQLETLVAAADTACSDAASVCYGENYWSYGQTVDYHGSGTRTWGLDWVTSLRQRASLLRTYEEVGKLGAGAAGGAGPALGAAYQWALNNGDENLSFEDWYANGIARVAAREAATTVNEMLASGETLQAIQNYIESQTGLTTDATAELMAMALAATLQGAESARGHALAAQLKDQLDIILPNSDDAAEAFRLIVSGTPVNIAIAVATGDWSSVPGGDPTSYGEQEKRVVLNVLGLELPDDLSPGDLIGINEVIGALPDDVVAGLFNIGWTFEAAGGAGLSTPFSLVLPANASATRQLGGEVSLSDVEIGIGFQQTHTVEISATYTGALSVYGGKSTLGKAYKALEVFGKLSSRAQAILDRFPALGRISKGLPISIEQTWFAGTELTYEATLTPEQAQALAGGDGTVLPDIFAPLDLEPGNSLLIRGGAIQGSTFAAKYKLLYVEDTITEFDGLGFGVTRLDDGKYAIYSGPIEAIENQSFLGLRFGVTAGFSKTTELSFHDFNYAELDLDTPEGQTAYAEFISGGGVPTTSLGPGVTPAKIEVIDIDSETGLAAGLGSLGFEWQLSQTNTELLTKTYVDGTSVYEGTASFGNASAQFTAPVLADGSYDFDASTTTIVVADVNGHMVEALLWGYEGASMGDEDIDLDDQHIQVSFTGPELVALQDLAQESVWLRWEDDEYYAAVMESPGIDLISTIAAADSPEDLVTILSTAADFRPMDLVAQLTELGLLSVIDLGGDVLPGTFSMVPTD